jgi:hypothetical protein
VSYDPWADPAADPYADDPTQQALLQYLLGGGVMGNTGGYLGPATPTLGMGQFNTAYGLIPQDDDVLRQNARGANYAQDVMSMQADPMMLAYAGAGAFDPTAFEPLVNERLVDAPELAAFNTYLANPDSFRGSVAQILKEGGDPTTLVRDLQGLLGFDPLDFTDPELDPVARELPWMQDERTGRPTQINWMGVQDEIQKIVDQFNAIPQAGPMGQEVSDDGSIVSEGGERSWTYDDSGRLIVAEQTYRPSPMTEEFRRLGLPSPMEQFTTEQLLGPSWESERVGLEPYEADMQEAMARWREEQQDWRNMMNPQNVPEPVIDRAAAQQALGAAPAAAEPEAEPGPGVQSVGGFNIPWAGSGGPNPAVPGAPGAVGSMSTLRESIPWAVDATANQMVPGLPLNTDAAGAVISAGAGNDVVRNATTAANNPAGVLWGGLQSGWNWLFPQEEAAPPAGVQGIMGPQTLGASNPKLPAGRIAPRLDAQQAAAIQNAMWDRLTSGEGGAPPGSAPPGTTVPEQQSTAPQGDALDRWMADLASSGTPREGAIAYATANGADPTAAGRAYDQAAAAAAGREAPPSASEIPQAPEPAPPHPASTWPPTLLYDPWAPQQATDVTMGANLGLGRPAFSPAFVGANNPMAAINADPRMEWLAAQQQRAGQWQPPQQDWLGINWGGQEPPPTPGPLPEPRQERTGLGQWQPPSPDWLGINWTGRETGEEQQPARDETEPGHYNVQLPPQNPQIAEYLRNAAARPRQSGSLTGAFGLTPDEIAQIMPQGTGQLSPTMAEAMTRDWLQRAGGGGWHTMNTGEGARTDEGQAAAGGSRTGEGRTWGQAQTERAMEQGLNVFRGRKRAHEADREAYFSASRDFLRRARKVYNQDYGRALAQAEWMQQQGITPTTAALAARQLPIAAMGLTSPGQLTR